MKRTLFLILLGASAMPALLPADQPPPENPGVAAPDNSAMPGTGPAVAPAPQVGNQPLQNVVENGAPRGPLGSLATGAPGVAEKLPAPAAGAAVATPPAATAPPAGVASATAVTTVQKTAVVNQALPAKIPHEIVVMEAMAHCFFDAVQQAHKTGVPLLAGGGFPFLPPAGDLQLLSLQQLSGNPAEPPLYRVSFKNLSRFAATNFRVSIIATNGRVNRLSPVVSAEIEELAADAIANIDLRVPATALTLGPANAPVAFDTVIVVLDSLNVLAETNEWNNVTQFVRTDIVTVEVTETTASSTAVAAPPGAAGTVAPAVVPARPAAPNAAPSVAPNPAPNVAPMSPPQAAPDANNGNGVSIEEIDEAAALLRK